MATLSSHYKSMGIFSGTQGQLTSQSEVGSGQRVLMHIIIICKYEKDCMKNSREKVVTLFLPLLPYLHSPWPDLAEFRTHSSSYLYLRYLQV